MRVGYSFWGYLGDHKYDANGKPASTPDGNATYSYALVKRLMEAGHEVLPMQIDRDLPGVKLHGKDLFAAFSQETRLSVYEHLSVKREEHDSDFRFPELDVLLLEWRFPIPGRNTPEDLGRQEYQGDLERQTELLRHYSSKKTRIIFWDLDHKLTKEDEQLWLPNAVFETSYYPLKLSEQRTSVMPPLLTEDLLQFPTIEPASNRGLVYIGSRYERDDVIDEWIAPIGKRAPVEFWGKWDKEAELRWPNVSFHTRVTTSQFRGIYSSAPLVPLLAKRSYMETGFVTPRPAEAVMFGSIPIALGRTAICRDLTFSIDSVDKLVRAVNEFAEMTVSERDVYRNIQAQRLEFWDAKHFVKQIEEVAR